MIDSPSDFPDDVFPLQPLKTLVQFDVIYMVVVSLREQQLLLHNRTGSDETGRGMHVSTKNAGNCRLRTLPPC